jgi:8-oxo-dGTP diphosphatase
MTTVVAAIIEQGGRILICRRRPDGAHPLKWEFPGGKVEPGELPSDALRRELVEELAITAEIGPEVTRYEYTYPGKKPILLIFYRVTRFDGEPRNQVFHQIQWDEPARLPDYDFLEGDVDFVRTLGTAPE